VLALLSLAVISRTPQAQAAAEPPPVSAPAAELPAILAAIKAPGARAVLVNVWATWCEPCRAELPELIRFYRAHKASGLRLVMVSADGEGDRPVVEKVLREAGFDGPAFIKRGEDDPFINALEPRWSGALPATVLFDGAGARRQFWPGPVGESALEKPIAALLSAPPAPKTRRRP
jgi:thiol-disulfide isomerase/thioredoxin